LILWDGALNLFPEGECLKKNKLFYGGGGGRKGAPGSEKWEASNVNIDPR